MVRYPLTGDPLGEMSRHWWLVVLRGFAAILFGVVALVWPDKTLVALAIVFGVYALADGAALGYTAYRAAPGTRTALAVRAVLSALLGLIALFWPLAAVLALVLVIGLWAVLTGVAEIATAIRLRAHISSEWLLVFVGALSIVFGLLLWFWPLEGAQAIMFVIAMYAVIFGAVMAVAGFRLRGAADAPGSGPARPLGFGEAEEPFGDESYRPADPLANGGEHGDREEWEDRDEHGRPSAPPGGRHRAPESDEEYPDEPR